MNKTVSSVMDLSEPWDNPHGGQVWYVTAFTTDGEVLSAGRKTEEDADLIRRQLQDAIGEELDFTLAPDKPTKSGKTKWKILGFGVPGEEPAYTAPGVQGGGSPANRPYSASRSPEHDQFIQERMDRRTALMQAVTLVAFPESEFSAGDLPNIADGLYDWLRQTSDASSAYSNGSGTVTPVAEDQAGASEDSGGGVESEGKEPAPPSHHYDIDPNLGIIEHQHIHDWQPHPNLRNKLKCECGEMRNKEAVK